MEEAGVGRRDSVESDQDITSAYLEEVWYEASEKGPGNSFLKKSKISSKDASSDESPDGSPTNSSSNAGNTDETTAEDAEGTGGIADKTLEDVVGGAADVTGAADGGGGGGRSMAATSTADLSANNGPDGS